MNNQRAFLNYIAKKFDINSLDGWYQMTPRLLMKHGGSDLLIKYNDSLFNILRTIYPTYLMY